MRDERGLVGGAWALAHLREERKARVDDRQQPHEALRAEARIAARVAVLLSLREGLCHRWGQWGPTRGRRRRGRCPLLLSRALSESARNRRARRRRGAQLPHQQRHLRHHVDRVQVIELIAHVVLHAEVVALAEELEEAEGEASEFEDSVDLA